MIEREAAGTSDVAATDPPGAHLYVQVLIAIGLGAMLGHFWPHAGEALKPLGDGFIKLVKMIIAPVIFLTVVTGIAGMRDLGSVGRVAANLRMTSACSSPTPSRAPMRRSPSALSRHW